MIYQNSCSESDMTFGIGIDIQKNWWPEVHKRRKNIEFRKTLTLSKYFVGHVLIRSNLNNLYDGFMI